MRLLSHFSISSSDLDLLFYIASYADLEKYVPENEKELFRYYAKTLRKAVQTGTKTYEGLRDSTVSEISESAQNLIKTLKE